MIEHKPRVYHRDRDAEAYVFTVAVCMALGLLAVVLWAWIGGLI